MQALTNAIVAAATSSVKTCISAYISELAKTLAQKSQDGEKITKEGILQTWNKIADEFVITKISKEKKEKKTTKKAKDSSSEEDEDCAKCIHVFAKDGKFGNKGDECGVKVYAKSETKMYCVKHYRSHEKKKEKGEENNNKEVIEYVQKHFKKFDDEDKQVSHVYELFNKIAKKFGILYVYNLEEIHPTFFEKKFFKDYESFVTSYFDSLENDLEDEPEKYKNYMKIIKDFDDKKEKAKKAEKKKVKETKESKKSKESKPTKSGTKKVEEKEVKPTKSGSTKVAEKVKKSKESKPTKSGSTKKVTEKEVEEKEVEEKEVEDEENEE